MKRVRVTIEGKVVQELDADRELIVGRGKEADIRIADKQVSTRHARIVPEGGRLLIADLGSTNGTLIDGGDAIPADVTYPVERGQKITIGPAILEVVEPAARPESGMGFGEDPTMVVGGDFQKSLLVEIARFKAARPRLVVAATHSRRVVPIEEMEVTVGRENGCQVLIDLPSVSGKHAAIRFKEGRFSVTDLGSSNGTQVDGQTVTGATNLAQESCITFGTVDCLFIRSSAEAEADDPSAMLANHAANLGKITRHQAQEAIAEHRDTGCSIGEVLVREGMMSPSDWVALWKRREDIALLGGGAVAASEKRSGPQPLWIVVALLIVALLVVILMKVL